MLGDFTTNVSRVLRCERLKNCCLLHLSDICRFAIFLRLCANAVKMGVDYAKIFDTVFELCPTEIAANIKCF